MITAIRFNGVGISALGSMLTGGISAFPRNAVGFVHAVERKLAQRGASLGAHRRVAIGIENYRLHKGEKNPTTPKMALWRPWKRRGDLAPSVLDYELKCNATVTLLIGSEGTLESEKLQEALVSIVPSMRFANGSIFVKSGFVAVVPGSDKDALTTALKAVRGSRSQFVIGRDDLIEPQNEFTSFVDALALIAESIEAAPENDTDSEQTDFIDVKAAPTKRQWKRKQDGLIIPLERGYQAVTRPVTGRPGSRDLKTPTVAVTPVLGLGELVSARRFHDNLDSKAFWSSKSDRQAGYYLFNATSFND